MSDPRLARMRRWLEEVCAELDVDPAVLDTCTGPLLDLVRDVAHGPSRPGAPLTAFLVGLAAGGAPGAAAFAGADRAVLDRIAAVERLLERDGPTRAPSGDG